MNYGFGFLPLKKNCLFEKRIDEKLDVDPKKWKEKTTTTYALTYVASWPGAAEQVRQLPHLISEADLRNFLKISALVRSFFSCLTLNYTVPTPLHIKVNE